MRSGGDPPARGEPGLVTGGRAVVHGGAVDRDDPQRPFDQLDGGHEVVVEQWIRQQGVRRVVRRQHDPDVPFEQRGQKAGDEFSVRRIVHVELVEAHDVEAAEQIVQGGREVVAVTPDREVQVAEELVEVDPQLTIGRQRGKVRRDEPALPPADRTPQIQVAVGREGGAGVSLRGVECESQFCCRRIEYVDTTREGGLRS